jgi:hypothetical protein
MKKGLVTLFVASMFAATVSSYALAPTVRDLPDITIGDQEDNIGATDNNWFVFTNAFKFDDYAEDPEGMPKDQLAWSFDELELGASTAPWFQVNGIGPIHVGSQMAVDETTNDAAHVAPTADLRNVSEYASFRDIVLSPLPTEGPFSDSSEAALHGVGRDVRFLVSDGELATRANEILVKTLDDGNDLASAAAAFVPWRDELFSTNNTGTPGGLTGWIPLGLTTNAQTGYPSGLVAYDWDATNGAYRGRAYSSLTATADQRYRAAGWMCNSAEWMPYSEAGTDKYVRCKYYIYAQEANAGAFANKNIIPNLRVRVSERFALTSNQEVYHHQSSDPGNSIYSNELAPSTNPASPSLYRVDLAPIPVPYLTSNPTTEGFARAFENYSLETQEAGYICMTESVLGTYPKSLADGTLLQAYDDINDLKAWVPAAETTIYNLAWPTGTLFEGMFPNVETTGNLPTVTEGASSITLDSTNVATDRIAVAVRNFNPDANTNNNAIHPRVEAGKQYRIRFHLTSTQNTNRQAAIVMRARTIKFAWSQKLELAGAWATGGTDATPGANNTITQQTTPGVGCQNPYKDGTENGGWYTLILHSPMYAELGQTQTDITAAPGPGNSATSIRDIRVGLDLIDSLDFGNVLGYQEKGNVTVDKIEVYGANLVAD